MKRAISSCLIGLGILAASVERPARAADRPLLVVVEAPPALDADAAEIRRAIGNELRSETIAPMKTPADPPERALIVALDREHIAMSLRTNDGVPVARSIPSPPDHAGRLRAIAWLAGNLARDQVGPIVAETTTEPSPLSAMPALTPPAQAAPPSATAPPAMAPEATSTSAVIASTPTDESGPKAPRWSIGVADGPITNSPVCNKGSGYQFCRPLIAGLVGSAWRMEVQRRSRRDGSFMGAALEGTTGQYAPGPQLIGVTGFVGSVKHLGSWEFEATLGLGLEAAQDMESTVTTTSSTVNGFMTMLTTSEQIRPALYTDAAVGVSHPVSGSLDLALRVGLHLNTNAFADWFYSTTLGLRYNLQ